MAQFIARVFHYLIGEALVKTLAESQTFQRFAVRTDAALKQHKATVKAHGDRLVQEAIKKTENIKGGSETVKEEGSSIFGQFGKFVRQVGSEIKKDVAPTAATRKNYMK